MINLFWFRRDLRLQDNAALYNGLKSKHPLQPIFIFDTNILDHLEKDDARVNFIYNTIIDLKKQLKELNSDLWIFYGKPVDIYKTLIKKHTINALFLNRDYESYAIERDNQVKDLLTNQEIQMHEFKDHIIFEKHEVTKADGLPYTVFTPYKRKWLEKLESRKWKKNSYYLTPYPTEKYFDNLNKTQSDYEVSMSQMGFKPNTEIKIPETEVKRSIIKNYEEKRNFPAIEGTSKLGIHFRFGTISIREKALKAQKISDTYLSELIWRDFYSQILASFPHVESKAFRAKYERIEWRNNEKEFAAWCEGKTGYPLVDAGMRELNNTGHMHNRVRMVVASFLTKHLLIDWRWGEAYFAEKLLDFDLASNNGGWQWAAGCGTDAAPYFRIFNPTSQMEKFDKQKTYIQQWIPEWGTDKYPDPIVDHKFARERCLNTYKEALK